MSVATVITMGYGSFGNPSFVVTLGYGDYSGVTATRYDGWKPHAIRAKMLQDILNDDDDVIQLFSQMLPQIIAAQLERKS